MRRLIYCLFAMFVATLSANAQVDSLYLFSATYHTTRDCPKIIKHGKREVVAIKDLKKSPFHRHYRCYKCMSSYETDSIKQVIKFGEYKQPNEIYMAGKYLEKSANCQYAAIGFGAVGGFIASIPAWKTDMGDGGRKACFSVGAVFGVAAFVSEICAINYKFSAGTSLKISATHIQYNF